MANKRIEPAILAALLVGNVVDDAVVKMPQKEKKKIRF